ncbi:hypothetical protein [Peptoniphilus lacydonensis]|uniref:hypothetical protein n=1 Tax=Peptoniphilus lacydonensis TaxID=1673725 RepID=UPI00290214D2|nr:hypothetical protein [Peptoniphilus lacydonensis]MBS6611545.1 hypothetical protein [Peptoniphilus harei]MDU1955565.1 hypothetical protein [Peptoniphilus lacydonensis]MDU5378175.1 hypothetical protein [Peptoniphilus lacydonensis]MDU5437554.1 hypothetical protein [Peptoniphilus lacydonensis]
MVGSWVLGLKKERYKSDKKGKQDLLHDIIFKADSRDAFMIIGVDELKLKNYNKLVIINLLYRC